MARHVSPRWAARTGLAASSALALTLGLLSFGGAAHAASVNPYAPSYGHPYRHGAVPTQEVFSQMRTYQQSHATPNVVAAANDLNYGGGNHGIGVTTGAPKVYLVFYGSQWGSTGTDANGNTTFSGDTVGMAPRLQQLFKGIGAGGELYSGVMTQYCEGVSAGSQTCPASSAHVGYPTGGALAGVWADTGSASPTAANGHQLGVVAVAAASHFGNTNATANRNAQYVVVSPRGTRPDGFNAGGGFCAWHDWNGDTTLTGGAVTSTVGDIAFTNMPYVTDAGASCGQNFVNSGSTGTLDGVTIVEGHEYAETITDQNPAGGWTDSTGFENADKCAWVSSGSGASANFGFTTGTFAMQTTWSNDVHGCQMTHSVVGGGGGGNTVTVTNPGSQSSTVGTAVSLHITATDSGSGTTLTYSASGLPAGLSIGSSSGTITGTPTTAGTSSVTVTVTDNTGASGSTSFGWTVTPVGGGCTGAGQKIGNPGFETGSAAPWSATAGVIDSSTSQPAHSGSWKAWLDGYGRTHTDTLTQSVAVPAGCTSATFSFWLHIDTSESTTSVAFDTLTVKVGSTTVATYSNLDKASGYSQKSFNVGNLAGTTVTISFSGVEDSSLQTSFVVDDTALTVS
jgi:Putative Ig domain